MYLKKQKDPSEDLFILGLVAILAVASHFINAYGFDLLGFLTGSMSVLLFLGWIISL